MSDCRFGVSPVNYPDPDPDTVSEKACLGGGGGGRIRQPTSKLKSLEVLYQILRQPYEDSGVLEYIVQCFFKKALLLGQKA